MISSMRSLLRNEGLSQILTPSYRNCTKYDPSFTGNGLWPREVCLERQVEEDSVNAMKCKLSLRLESSTNACKGPFPSRILLGMEVWITIFITDMCRCPLYELGMYVLNIFPASPYCLAACKSITDKGWKEGRMEEKEKGRI